MRIGKQQSSTCPFGVVPVSMLGVAEPSTATAPASRARTIATSRP